METDQKGNKINYFVTFTVYKPKGQKTGSYEIEIQHPNPRTGRIIVKRFRIMVTANIKENTKNRWNENIVAGAALKYFSSSPTKKLEVIKGVKSKKHLGLEIYHLLRNITRRKGSDLLLGELETEGKKYLSLNEEEKQKASLLDPSSQQPKASDFQEEGNSISDAAAAGVSDEAGQRLQTLQKEIASKATPKPSESIFVPEITGVTYAILGKSFQGKTTFIVGELNKLTEQQLNQYNAIIFFTESAHALPLKDVAPNVKPKIIMMDRYCPKVLQALKRINDATELLFKFLVIFDDITHLRGSMATKCILTLRNSNISTALSVQNEKLLNPAQRSSVHNVYFFNLYNHSWEFLLKGYVFGTLRRLLPETFRNIKSAFTAADLMHEVMDNYILHYNQREDKTALWIKK